MYIYMKVTSDEFEFPIAIASSVKELSNITGVKPKSISSMIYHGQKGFRKVEIEDEE